MWFFQIIGGGLEVTRAIVLINTKTGKEDSVLEEVKKVQKVEEAYITYGVYDIVVKIQAKDLEELKGVIADNIRHAGSVRSTMTLVIMND